LLVLLSSDVCLGPSLSLKHSMDVAQSVEREAKEIERQGASKMRESGLVGPVREKAVGSGAMKRRAACRGGQSLCKSF
jgi:hypothetical protein